MPSSPSAALPDPAARSPRADTASRYRVNAARHLIGISRDLQDRVRRALAEECGFTGLRPSFGPFLSLIRGEGRALAEIADELAISRQAASQLANLVEAAGYLERRSNPEDRRSRLVSVTPRGHALVREGARILLETDAEYAALVGDGAWRRFTGGLAKLYRSLGLPTHADPGLPPRASRSIGVLPLVAEWIQRELMDATAARGHAGLKMSHGQVLPLIGPEGGRVATMARVQRVSRQAISATTQDLETLGYLRREADSRDRRAVVLRLTERGERLIADSVSAMDDLEARLRAVLGGSGLDHLERVARVLYDALGLEAEIFGTEDPTPPRALDPPIRRPGRNLDRLADRLRHWLGEHDSERLAMALGAGGAPRAPVRNAAHEPTRRTERPS